MSVIHINQIRRRIDTLFNGIVDMSDQKKGTKSYEDMFLSRSLAAYATFLSLSCTE